MQPDSPTTSLIEASPPLILAIDLGTSSIRAVLFDRLGRMVSGSSARRDVHLKTTREGAAVIEPLSLLESVYLCIDEALEQTKIREVAAVAACTFASSLLGVDAAGRAVTPVYTYADSQPTAEAALLRDDLDEAAVHQRTGCLFHPSYWPARFLWLAQRRPAEMAAASRWMTIGEYLFLRLFGQTAVSYSAASWTGLLDRFRLEWDRPLLDHIPLRPEQLSPLVDVDHAFTGLKQEFAVRWPALRKARWFPAVGDGAAANIGSGCTGPERVAVTMGTSTAVRAVLPGNPDIPPGLWCYRVDRELSLLGGALSEGGNIFDWLLGSLQLDEFPDLDGALLALPADRHGLTFLPLLAGERSPGWVGSARGVIAGLSLATGPLEILKSGLEGVAARVALVYRRLQPSLADEAEIIASGGALMGSPAWAQITADMLGRPLFLSGTPEASARGAAILAMRSVGQAIQLDRFPVFSGPVFYPDPARHARYQDLIHRQQALYNSLIAP